MSKLQHENEIQNLQPTNPFAVNADEGDPNISSPTMVFDMPEKEPRKLQQSPSFNLRSRPGTLRKNFNTSFLNRTSSRGSSLADKTSNSNNPFLQQQPSQPQYQEEKQQQQQQQQLQRQESETAKATEEQHHHHHHRFGKPTQSLKRMFSRRSKQQQGPPPPQPEPYKRTTEQEGSDAVNGMREPPVSRKRTIRRNAVFGAS